MTRAIIAAPFLALLGFSGCAAPQAPDPRYPARELGCPVVIFPDAPNTQTDNLGTVSATCGDSVSDQDCLRTLKDEACKLGGDVVWGVPEKPAERDGKKSWAGRAAHSKEPKPAPTIVPSG